MFPDSVPAATLLYPQHCSRALNSKQVAQIEKEEEKEENVESLDILFLLGIAA